MSDLYKLYRVMLIGLIGIVLTTSCSNPFAPKVDICKALFVNTTPTRLTLSVDGKAYWDNNFFPGQVWIKDGLDDGSVHTFEAHALDPRVFHVSGTFKVVMGHTHVYDIYEVNTVVRIGGAISSATTPDTLSTR